MSQQSKTNTNGDNTFEITSDLMTLDANGKSILTLDQKQESTTITSKNTTIECKDKITLVCGDSTIEISTSSISIKHGQSSIELNSTGVTVKGSQINLG